MSGLHRFNLLLDVLEEMALANESTPILVEGKRDVRALRALGCGGAVVPLHNGRSLFGVAEDLAASGENGIILLTDWDRKGDELRASLANHLEANGVRVDAAYRSRIRELVATQLKDVESLLPHIRRNLARFHQRTLEEYAHARHGLERFLASRLRGRNVSSHSHGPVHG